ncbi:MAG: ABC transporter substrate-binding protein, partial [Propionibacterium sp.]
MKKLLSALVIGALALTACGGGESSTSGKQGGYDISSIAKVDEIADSLPDDIKSKGKIVVGMSADYAPAEFLDDDLKTPIGYDVEFGKAIGKVLGIEVSFENAQFDSILGAIGTKYDLGISSFTITEERLKAANMISYIEVGSSFGVAKGNPKGISVDELCGLAIGVQT